MAKLVQGYNFIWMLYLKTTYGSRFLLVSGIATRRTASASQGHESSDRTQGAHLGAWCYSLRDRWKLQRSAQGTLQTSNAALGKLHVCEIRREAAPGALQLHHLHGEAMRVRNATFGPTSNLLIKTNPKNMIIILRA